MKVQVSLKVGSDVRLGYGGLLKKSKKVAKRLVPDRVTLSSGPLRKGFGEIAAAWEKSEGRKLTPKERSAWFDSEMERWLAEAVATRRGQNTRHRSTGLTNPLTRRRTTWEKPRFREPII